MTIALRPGQTFTRTTVVNGVTYVERAEIVRVTEKRVVHIWFVNGERTGGEFTRSVAQFHKKYPAASAA